MVNVDDTQMDNGSPRANSPIKQPTPEKEAAPPAKKQLSSAQKASQGHAKRLGRASWQRVKQRQTKKRSSPSSKQ